MIQASFSWRGTEVFRFECRWNQVHFCWQALRYRCTICERPIQGQQPCLVLRQGGGNVTRIQHRWTGVPPAISANYKQELSLKASIISCEASENQEWELEKTWRHCLCWRNQCLGCCALSTLGRFHPPQCSSPHSWKVPNFLQVLDWAPTVVS